MFAHHRAPPGFAVVAVTSSGTVERRVVRIASAGRIDVAARISALAGPGELLVSDVALAELEHDNVVHLRCGPIGAVQVRRVSEPIWLQRVTT